MQLTRTHHGARAATAQLQYDALGVSCIGGVAAQANAAREVIYLRFMFILMKTMMPGSSHFLLVALCSAVTVLTSTSASAAASAPELHSTISPKFPIVVNTWPFVNATRVAFQTLTQDADASAVDAVENVRPVGSVPIFCTNLL